MLFDLLKMKNKLFEINELLSIAQLAQKESIKKSLTAAHELIVRRIQISPWITVDHTRCLINDQITCDFLGD